MVDLLRDTEPRALSEAAHLYRPDRQDQGDYRRRAPEGLVQIFSTLFADKIEKTNAAAFAARRQLGW